MPFSLTAAWASVNLVLAIARVHRHANGHRVRHPNRIGDGHLLLNNVRYLDRLLFANPFAHANLVRLDVLLFDHAASLNRHLANLLFGDHATNLHGLLAWNSFDNLAA